MFWSGNYIVVRELNFLLKEENVTLSQVLEADDILQECKADNKNLMQFLTRPDILAELITLITEEPPQNVELTSQYRLASIACEVLTSDLSTLSDKLSMDVTQMNRLCDFIAKPPPLNPLLASYFSKTVEMLLERSTKQDWYLYHIVCLRVLDFFKSRHDFLPNLLRHMATSAIAETFRYFIRLDDLFNKIVMEWFEEHQLLESLIQVVCGGYLPEEGADEKGQRDGSEKHLNHTHHAANDTDTSSCGRSLSARLQAVASANAAALLCDVIVCDDTRTRTMDTLISRLQSEEYIRLLLQSMFTSPPHARAFAVVNGCRLLLASLTQEPVLSSGEGEGERSAVELGIAPHLPLLHQALLHDPRGGGPGVGLPRLQLAELVAYLALSELDEICTALRALGTAGVLVDMMFSFPHNNFLHAEVCTLVKHALANRVFRTQYATHLLLECDLLTRLMDVFEENENKKPVGDSSSSPGPRAAYMGHVVVMLERIARALDANDGELARLLPAPLLERWTAFTPGFLQLVQQRHVPLGGYYPSENIYEVENMADSLAAEYDFHDMSATATLDDIGDELAADGLNELHLMGAGAELAGDDFASSNAMHQMQNNVSDFLERARQRFDDEWAMQCFSAWDDAPSGDAAADDDDHADDGAATDDSFQNFNSGNTWLPWEQEGGGPEAGAGWAQFDALPAPPPPVDPFAPLATPAPTPAASSGAGDEEFCAFWPPAAPPAAPPARCDETQQLERSVQELQLEDASSVSLASHLLTAMSALPPDQLATIVNADLAPISTDVTPLAAAVTPLPAAVTPLAADVTPLPAAVTPLAADVTPLPAGVTCDAPVINVADVTNHKVCASDSAAASDAPTSSNSTSADAGGTGTSAADSGGSTTADAHSSSAADASNTYTADAGSSSCDTGNSSRDTGSSSCDTGNSSRDTGSSSCDTGSSSCDTGSSSCDTGSSSCDTGSSDTGSCDAGGDS